MEDLVRIVSAADGEIVGRTRLQKAAFLLELAGLGSGYEFKYNIMVHSVRTLHRRWSSLRCYSTYMKIKGNQVGEAHTLSSLRAPLTKGTMEILTSSLFL